MYLFSQVTQCSKSCTNHISLINFSFSFGTLKTLSTERGSPRPRRWILLLIPRDKVTDWWLGPQRRLRRVISQGILTYGFWNTQKDSFSLTPRVYCWALQRPWFSLDAVVSCRTAWHQPSIPDNVMITLKARTHHFIAFHLSFLIFFKRSPTHCR